MYRTGELSFNQISRIFGIDEQKCLDLIEESESAGNQS
jgi:hypothetical protein